MIIALIALQASNRYHIIIGKTLGFNLQYKQNFNSLLMKFATKLCQLQTAQAHQKIRCKLH